MTRLQSRLTSAFAVVATFGVLSTPATAAFKIEEATIAALHAALLAGEVTCRQVTEAHLARIAAYDDKGPALNAVITVNPRALAVADEMDRELKASPAAMKPLFCVPVILKDNFDTADMVTTGGSLNLKNSQPLADAFMVTKLRAAGAIMLAKANLQELAMGGNSVSSLAGQVLNPYDLTRTPGGSSGGTGAAVAASFGILGTGSDTGQSIRSPASANNLVGIRATRGLVSRGGVIPNSITQDEVGPITRTVEDAARMLDVIAGFDPKDPVTALGHGKVPKSYTEFLDPNALKGARIGVLRDLVGREAIHAEVNAVLERDIAIMKAAGAEVIDITIANFAALSAGMGTGNFEYKIAMNEYLKSLGANAPFKNLTEFVAAGGYLPDLGNGLKSSEAMVDGMAKPEYAAVFLKRDNFQKAVMVAMASNRLDAILYPLQKQLVAKVGSPQLERNGILSNATGFPAVSFPGGFSPPTAEAPLGVPIGIELLGPAWSEGKLIGFAYAFEQAAKLRVMPKSTPPLGVGF
jgi:Asp-tRNA(Asn)/Glu-tRNA(Gln) amidotransferase A subunit family amidase